MGTLFLLVSSESIKGHILNVLCGCNERNWRDQVYYFLCQIFVQNQITNRLFSTNISCGRHLRLISHRLEKGPWGRWGGGEGTLSLNIRCAPKLLSPLQPTILLFCHFYDSFAKWHIPLLLQAIPYFSIFCIKYEDIQYFPKDAIYWK